MFSRNIWLSNAGQSVGTEILRPEKMGLRMTKPGHCHDQLRNNLVYRLSSSICHPEGAQRPKGPTYEAYNYKIYLPKSSNKNEPQRMPST